MIKINLKECELKNNTYENVKEWIDKAIGDNGYLAEMITYIYYYCIKDYEIWHLEKIQSQNDLGDFFIYDGIQPFYIDSKSSHLYNNLPKACIDLSYWKYSVGHTPFYGIKVIKEHNYGWIYELKYCSKIFYFNKELKQCFIIEDFQAIRSKLLNNYLTKKLSPKEIAINNFNYSIDKCYKPCKAIEIVEKKETVREPTANGYTEYEKVTQGLAILLTKEIISALGSELTIIQLEY